MGGQRSIRDFFPAAKAVPTLSQKSLSTLSAPSTPTQGAADIEVACRTPDKPHRRRFPDKNASPGKKTLGLDSEESAAEALVPAGLHVSFSQSSAPVLDEDAPSTPVRPRRRSFADASTEPSPKKTRTNLDSVTAARMPSNESVLEKPRRRSNSDARTNFCRKSPKADAVARSPSITPDGIDLPCQALSGTSSLASNQQPPSSGDAVAWKRRRDVSPGGRPPVSPEKTSICSVASRRRWRAGSLRPSLNGQVA